jgi:S1-C subfamily serine protease
MMRKFFAALLLSLLIALPVPLAAKHKQFDPFQGFGRHDVETAAVGAILIPNPNPANGDGPYGAICSGAVIGSDTDGNALFLTARHCVWDADATIDTPFGSAPNPNPNPHFIQNEYVSFNANLSGPYYATEVYEVAANDDLALIKVLNAGRIIPEVLEDEHQLSPGDPIENVSIPLDMGKLEFHGRFVAPVFPHFSRFLSQDYPEWARTMPADITIANGSSGSPLFDSQTHELIGVVVGMMGESGLQVIEPESVVMSLLLDPVKNSVSNWIGAHLPKAQAVRVPKDRDMERHPYMPFPGSSSSD